MGAAAFGNKTFSVSSAERAYRIASGRIGNSISKTSSLRNRHPSLGFDRKSKTFHLNNIVSTSTQRSRRGGITAQMLDKECQRTLALVSEDVQKMIDRSQSAQSTQRQPKITSRAKSPLPEPETFHTPPPEPKRVS
jgi:hypothetical protein